uniref:cytochrome c oxidase subunit III n=1 Tax=Pseudodiaptomus hessei TaxID=2919416 RepID=UPI002A826CA7|nr:cytochrome c oxidase subunit III [Pseudodiaptomus hessei]WOH21601.1 cytochrome c oxidase subunit 3 [Pseudodiaptomus hessei]
MSNMICHPYHMVDESPWPLYGSLGGLFLTSGMVSWFHLNSMTLFFLGLTILALVMIQWWRDVSREGSSQGLHSSIVELGLRWGMMLFIVSEIFFFLSFFWAFFHASLSPAIELGGVWPPMGISPFNPFQIPLLNTIILVSSGVSVTWAHHSLMEGNMSQTKMGLALTVILGVYFTALQAFEYYEASFSFADSVYGSTFFIATGFHGLHVIVGTIFLLVCLVRLINYEFSASHHFGFEAAAWYWHFVDVIWLFLYLVIYWWGGV